MTKLKIIQPNEAAKEAPSQYHANCQKCGRWETAKKPFMEATEGDGEYGIIAEGPGSAEDKYGEQFVGRTGRLLRSWADDVSFPMGDAFIQNTVRCGSAKPTLAQCRLCRPFLLRDLNESKPKKIIGMGAWAIKTMLNIGQVTVKKFRNRIIKIAGLDYEPENVTLTYHPSGFLHGNLQVRNHIKGDLKRFMSTRKLEKKINRITNLKTLRNLCIYYSNLKQFSVDTEWALDGRLLCVSMCSGAMAHWFPVDHAESPWTLGQVLEPMKIMLRRDNVKMGHNFPSDMETFAKFGVNTAGPIVDTLILIRMIDRLYSDKSLEAIAMRFLGYPDYAVRMRPYKQGIKVPTGELTPSGKAAMKTVYDYGKAPLDILGEYCAWDAWATYDIGKKYIPKARTQKWWKLYLMYMRASKVLCRNTVEGFRLDPKELERQKTVLTEQADILKDLFIQQIHPHWFKTKPFRFKADQYDPNNADLSDLLYKRLKLPVLVRTEDKKPATNAQAIKELLKQCERKTQNWWILSYLIGWTEISDGMEVKHRGLRQYDKLLNSFITRLLSKSEKRKSSTIKCEDGSTLTIPAGLYFKPGYTIAGAATGRLASKPNVQNIPKELRKAFVTRWRKKRKKN
jgi:uracil-DNA glycosylase family 4